jgi:hypothetical protein
MEYHMADNARSSLLLDKIHGNKYCCFSSNCRKTFNDAGELIRHQKVHVSDALPLILLV